jgi:hypothetical protein
MTDDEYREIYEKWESLPDCRIRIDLGDGGEGMWGKVLPNGLFGINNMPLHTEYQWQDIVSTSELRDKDRLVHRRWNQKIYYKWPEVEDQEASRAQRQKIIDLLKETGYHPGFWSKGTAYFLVEGEFDAHAGEKAADLLSANGIEIEFL